MLMLILSVTTGPATRVVRAPSPLYETLSATFPLQRFESCVVTHHTLASTSSVLGSLWPEHGPKWTRPMLPAASVPNTRGAVREAIAPEAALTLAAPPPSALRPAAPLGRPGSRAQTRLAVRSPDRAGPAVPQVSPRPEPGRHQGRHATRPGAGCRCSGRAWRPRRNRDHAPQAPGTTLLPTAPGDGQKPTRLQLCPAPLSSPRPPERSLPVHTATGPDVSTQRSPPPESSPCGCFSCWAPRPGQKRGAGKHRGREPPVPGCTLTHTHTQPPTRAPPPSPEGGSFSALQKRPREEKWPGQGLSARATLPSGDIWQCPETFLCVVT